MLYSVNSSMLKRVPLGSSIHGQKHSQRLKIMPVESTHKSPAYPFTDRPPLVGNIFFKPMARYIYIEQTCWISLVISAEIFFVFLRISIPNTLFGAATFVAPDPKISAQYSSQNSLSINQVCDTRLVPKRFWSETNYWSSVNCIRWAISRVSNHF